MSNSLFRAVSPMTTAPAKPTMKERILEAADRLFYLQGIRAIGVDTIAAEIGISKRTLYNHFPSKDALIAAYLERRFTKAPPSDKPPLSRSSGHSTGWSAASPARAFAAARSSTRSPNSAPATPRSERSRSPSRRAAGCGFAIYWCSLKSLTPRAWRRNSPFGRRRDRAGPGPQRPVDGGCRKGSSQGAAEECGN